jgi:hypothetical protein
MAVLAELTKHVTKRNQLSGGGAQGKIFGLCSAAGNFGLQVAVPMYGQPQKVMTRPIWESKEIWNGCVVWQLVGLYGNSLPTVALPFLFRSWVILQFLAKHGG